jgi:hypothetical protein
MNAISAATFLTVNASEAWRPDAECIAAGDAYVGLAARCYAAGGLSDSQIAKRGRLFGTDPDPPERLDAALALARHGALVGASARQIVAWLVHLALEVSCWPDDPAEIAAMVRAALRGVGR